MLKTGFDLNQQWCAVCIYIPEGSTPKTARHHHQVSAPRTPIAIAPLQACAKLRYLGGGVAAVVGMDTVCGDARRRLVARKRLVPKIGAESGCCAVLLCLCNAYMKKPLKALTARQTIDTYDTTPIYRSVFTAK